MGVCGIFIFSVFIFLLLAPLVTKPKMEVQQCIENSTSCPIFIFSLWSSSVVLLVIRKIGKFCEKSSRISKEMFSISRELEKTDLFLGVSELSEPWHWSDQA